MTQRGFSAPFVFRRLPEKFFVAMGVELYVAAGADKFNYDSFSPKLIHLFNQARFSP